MNIEYLKTKTSIHCITAFTINEIKILMTPEVSSCRVVNKIIVSLLLRGTLEFQLRFIFIHVLI